MTPQPPQLKSSLLGSVHLPLQLICPDGHPATQWPSRQVSPEAQGRKQPPQLLVSLVVSTHVPLQLVWPLGHCAVHTPLWQVRPAPHG
jgi:hypothetical protein